VCSCSPSFQAQVWSPRDRRHVRKTFAALGDAKAWRQEMQVAVRQGRAGAPSTVTLAEAASEWLELASRGVVRTRSGDRYKPSALRAYEGALRAVTAELGHLRLSAISRNHLQDLVDRLVADERAPSTVRNTLLPVRAIYRRALSREQVLTNPTLKLALPAVRGRRDRVARPEEAVALIAAVPIRDRAIWATAFYAGLRLGELRALGWQDVDLEHGLIRIEHSWDAKVGLIEPKSRSGRRRVPLTSTLRSYLLAHRLRQGRGGQGFALAETAAKPFNANAVIKRARAAWARAGHVPIRFHECRHTYAAFMIAAGVNAKALSTYMGHSTITITLDRYGHLLPGNEAEAATMLDSWLEHASSP
jgi:integrase